MSVGLLNNYSQGYGVFGSGSGNSWNPDKNAYNGGTLPVVTIKANKNDFNKNNKEIKSGGNFWDNIGGILGGIGNIIGGIKGQQMGAPGFNPGANNQPPPPPQNNNKMLIIGGVILAAVLVFFIIKSKK